MDRICSCSTILDWHTARGSWVAVESVCTSSQLPTAASTILITRVSILALLLSPSREAVVARRSQDSANNSKSNRSKHRAYGSTKKESQTQTHFDLPLEGPLSKTTTKKLDNSLPVSLFTTIRTSTEQAGKSAT